MSDRKQQLIEELRNKEYRATYAQQYVNSVLATQISTVRQQRAMTQQELAKTIGKHQPAISRSENVNYARWNITTLRQLADAYDCWLNIRFEPWRKLVSEVESFSVDQLRVDRFEDDPLFFGSEIENDISEPVRWMQKRVLPWLSERGDTKLLAAWLRGEELPPVGDEDPYFLWVARAVDVEPRQSPYRSLLVERLLDFLEQVENGLPSTEEDISPLVGVFHLLAYFPSLHGWRALRRMYRLEQRPALVEEGAVEAAFLNALIRNQVDTTLYPDWLKMIRGEHPWLAGNEFDALEGLMEMKPAPQFGFLADALNQLCECKQMDPNLAGARLTDYLVNILANLKLTFEHTVGFGNALMEEWSKTNTLYETLALAWSKVFAEPEESAEARSLQAMEYEPISEEFSIRKALCPA